MVEARNLGAGGPARVAGSRVSKPWLVLFFAMVCFIWGNSLVPAEGSGSLSLTVLTALQSFFDSLGVPHGWLTHFLVRKAAHFTEHLVLALVGMQAFRPHRASGLPRRKQALGWATTALALVSVPIVDETIQLFVEGRAGQATDVLIDCAGEAAGCLLTLLVARLIGRR